MKIILGRDYELRLVKILKLKLGRNADVRLRFWILIKIYVRSCYFGKQNSTLGSVVPLEMFDTIYLYYMDNKNVWIYGWKDYHKR